MSEENKRSNLGPNPWGSDPIKGLNYDYLDITQPPEVNPKPVMPETTTEMNIQQAEDFYKRIRGKVVNWAKGAGAGKDITGYVLLVPDIMALFVRMMGDPRVSSQLKAEIAAASAYIIVPIDLMPELAMGPAGLIDDAIVGMIALNRVITAMGQAGRDVALEHWDGDDDLFQRMEELLAKADQFVTGTVWNGIKRFFNDLAADIQTSARSGKQSSKPSSPIIEGSARPILPPGVTVEDDQLPPNERGGGTGGSTPSGGGTNTPNTSLPPNERG